MVRFDIGRATLGGNFDVTNGRAACEACSAAWNFGYQLSICSRIEENHGKTWSIWPVAGPSGCKLTSSPALNTRTSKLVPICALALFERKVYIFLLHFFFYMDILDEQQLNSSLTLLLITSRHGPYRKHRSSVLVYGLLPSNGRWIVSHFMVVA
jgi:hypothetical protein